MKKININPLSNKTLFNFLGGVIVLMVVAILAFWLNTLLSVQTARSGTQVEINKSSPEVVKAQLSLTPTPVSIQITPTSTLSSTPSGWQTYTDKQLGFSIQYPISWYEEDSSGTFQGQCFALSPEGLRSKPRFCIDFKPYVRLSPDEFASADFTDQQQFFEGLTNTPIKRATIVGSKQYIVTQHYQFAGFPAVERIETVAPGVEGVERAYTVAVYINTSQMGLLRLSMHALDQKQFEEHENTLRQMLGSFSLLK
jgi:hypothetical protein